MALHTGEKMILMRTREGAQRIEEAAGRIGNSLDRATASKLASLQVVALASEGEHGFPDLTLLVAPRGFLLADDAGRRLSVAIENAALSGKFREGGAFALSAILDGPRRRLHLSGQVVGNDAGSVTVAVDQHFSSEPRYLPEWERRPTGYAAPDVTADTQPRPDLSHDMQAFLAQADLLTVASRTPTLDKAATDGLDVSLRAGLSGFVQNIGATGFVWPEYPGSLHFSMLGNLVLDSRCSLLVTAAGRNEALELSGYAEVAWKNAATQQAGSDHAVQFRVRSARFVPDRFGAIYRINHYAPDLMAVKLPPALPRRMSVSRRVSETRETVSLYLRDPLGEPLRPLLAGQCLKLTLPDGVDRDYTISSFSPRPSSYRITAKLYPKETGGRGGSEQVHAFDVGAELDLCGPQGIYVLPRELERPIVMLSCGIGITPMIAFAEELAWRAPKHPIWFIHGARNGAAMLFARSLRALRHELPNARWHVRFSQPRDDDRMEKDYHSVGHVDRALLQELLPFGSYDFYLCGPDPFLASMVRDLRALDVPSARIHTESFGVVSDDDSLDDDDGGTDELPELFPRKVRFTRSGREAMWDPEQGTLLDFAEGLGIQAPHSCRTGMCGACSQGLVSGSIVAVRPTPFTAESGQILLCSTVPTSDVEIDL